jgi:NADPH-dependent glutamate synthase beta subunit-like oxidoreductase
VPGKHKMRWLADWQRYQMKKLGVEIRYRTSPGVEDLRPYDAVIVATGGRVTRPDIPGIDLPLVCAFADVLRCDRATCEHFFEGKLAAIDCGQTVLIWGDHFGAADAVERLAGRGQRVIVVTENREFATWMEPCHRDVMFKRFAGSNGEGLHSQTFQHPVTVIPDTTVIAVEAGGAVTLLDNRFQKRTLQVDNLVLAAVEPNDSLYQELLDAGLTAIKIGDARRVRNLRAAVTEGANAGLTLDEHLRLNANRALISKLPTEVRS